MTILDDSCVQVNIKQLEQEIDHLENKTNELRIVLLYARKQKDEPAQKSKNLLDKIPSLGIEQADVDYIEFNLLKKSQARVKLHRTSIERTGKPVHYQDFVQRVNQLGDNVKEASYYATVWRVSQNYGMKNIGGGFFDQIGGRNEVSEIAKNIFGVS